MFEQKILMNDCSERDARDRPGEEPLARRLRCPFHPNAGQLLWTETGDSLPTPTAATGWWQCRVCDRRYPILAGISDLATCDTAADDFLDVEARQWDEHAPRYEERRSRDQMYMAGVEATAEALGARPGEVILDAGCGTGFTVRAYLRPGVRVVALDLSLTSLRRLRHSLGAETSVLPVRGDLRQLPFADGTFDRVLCANAIQHLPNQVDRFRCVRELARVARPGARVVVTAHSLSVLKQLARWPKEGRAGSHSGDVRYIYRYGPAEFRALLSSALMLESITGAGLPLPYRLKLSLLSRALERFLRRFESSSLLGNMLVGVCRAS